MTNHAISWWNLENLFDVANSPRRDVTLAKKLKSELTGWTQVVLTKKHVQLASIIDQLNGGAGPDILGVCEVENKHVLGGLVAKLNLPNRNYTTVHHDMIDKRGIDVAFIIDADKYTVEDTFTHRIVKRSATRDLYQVNLRTVADNELLVLIGNHWPSRSAGQYESEPFRMIAGETVSYWTKRILEIHGKDTAIVVMGDLNDEPFNRSVMEYAKGTNSVTKVKKATTSPLLLNLMWQFCGSGVGTHYFDNYPNVLDQFLVSKGVVNGKSGFSVPKTADAVTIDMFDEMKSGGSYPSPINFGRPKKKSTFNDKGYSDHYPISMTLSQK